MYLVSLVTVPIKEDIRTKLFNNNFPENLKHGKHYLLFPSFLFKNFDYKFSKNNFFWSGVSTVKNINACSCCVFKMHKVIKCACDFGFIPKSSVFRLPLKLLGRILYQILCTLVNDGYAKICIVIDIALPLSVK